MSMQQVMRQMPAPAGRAAVARGEAERVPTSEETCGPRHVTQDTGSALLQAALTRENLQRALKRVRANKGAAGVDGLDIDQTARHLAVAWPAIREQLLAGTYRPSPVRRVLAHAGRMVAAPIEGYPAQALEARHDHLPRTARAGRTHRRGTPSCLEFSALVAQQWHAAEQRVDNRLL